MKKNKKFIVVILISILILSLCLISYKHYLFIHKNIQTYYMLDSRSHYTATQLKDGNILIAGGNTSSKAEIFNPVTGKSSYTGSLNVNRFAHEALLLDDGNVLVFGGLSHPDLDILANAEIYNYNTQKFENIGNIANCQNKSHSSLTKLDNGNILISCDKSASIYNPKTRKMTDIKDMPYNGAATRTTKLPDGNILLLGRFVKIVEGKAEAIFSTLIFDTKKYVYKPVHQMNEIDFPSVIFSTKDKKIFVSKLDDSAGIGVFLYDPINATYREIGKIDGERICNAVLLEDLNAIYFVADNKYPSTPPTNNIIIVLKDLFTSIFHHPNCVLFDINSGKYKHTAICPLDYKYSGKSFVIPNQKLLIIGGSSATIFKPNKNKEILIIDLKELKHGIN